MQPPALIICGPTASGKSALALEFARALGGTVINADAMQVYAGMAVITAQPSLAEHAAAPHRLYGIRSPAEAANLAWWREEALAAMAQARLPILCGGTGMYLRALTQGLSALPAVPPEARAEALEERGGTFLGFVTSHSVQEERHRDVLSEVECGDQVELLENEPDVLATEGGDLGLGKTVEARAEDINGAGVPVEGAGGDGEQGGLAAAGGTHEQVEFALGSGEVGSLERDGARVAGAEGLDDTAQ
jgi:DNA polymerase III delta prime subunit